MKKFSTAISSIQDAEQANLRHRKRGVMLSSLGYWFVVGIVYVIYARYLGGTRSIFVLIAQEFRPLTALLATAMVGMRVFAYQWIRLDATERIGGTPPFTALMYTLFFSQYLAETRTLGKSMIATLVLIALATGRIVTFWTGIYIASRVLLE